MTAELARTHPVSIRSLDEGGGSFANYQPINRHTGDPTPLPATPDWLATISAGKRGESRDGTKPGLPMMSRDGRIELHDPDGRAPGLAAALAATDHKRLLIAFVSNNPADVIQERIVGYTATTLKYHGDSESITELTPVRKVHRKGTPGYAEALKASTVSRRVFFALARWDDDGTPRVFFPDGLGLYCIRTTSARSTANIAATLALIGRQTGGIIVGLPFELSLSARQVADPAGGLRTVSLWSMVFSPPKTMQLTSGTFRMLAEKGIEQGRALVLPAPPRPESIEDAAYEGSFTVEDAPELCNPSAADIAIMRRGTPVDAAAARRRWFAIARGSIFGTDEGRAEFLSAWTDGNFDSLSSWLKVATQQEVDACLDALQRCGDCVPPMLPRAWDGLADGPSTDDGPDDFQAAVDAARAAQMRPQQTIDYGTGEIVERDDDPDVSPALAESAQFLTGVQAAYESAGGRDDLTRIQEQVKPVWDALSDAERAQVTTWKTEAVARLRRERPVVATAMDDIEAERQASAARNRAAIDAAHARSADGDSARDSA